MAVLTTHLVATAAPASAAPPTPNFGPAIEGYAPAQYQTTCDPTPKPGVVDFRDLLNRTYGTHTSGIVRDCSSGGTSEHKEGRALDYHFNISDPVQAAAANDVLNWLLATDRYGNPNAIARRLGILYIIWNRQIWQAGTWKAYNGDNAHTDHIHFSFGWPGARKQTSWWVARPYGERISDFSGDGYSDVLAVDGAGKLYYYPNNGVNLSTRTELGNGGWQNFKFARAADWSGDGFADVLGVDSAGQLFYYPNNNLGLGGRTPIGNGGWETFRHFMAADWSGDGHADVLGVDDAGLLWYYPHNGDSLSARIQIGNGGWESFKHVMAADFSGDGFADVLGVDADGLMWYYPHLGAGLGPRIQLGNGGWQGFRFVRAMDFSGDGFADVLGVDSAGQLFYYPNNNLGLGGRTPIGNGGWETFKFIL
ncbi:putative ATP/GTP-binding protein [[Actinomadura] parvosata subsp. kistnae]|uniref:ARB-07466-like C-terminal domain-containing protein n=1 Tax=[Actinomadura] parvosata subsp. kistnae TaxID=1909395 RepID=A0A1U9ZWZ3_9ACTN|nr:VCBS repeat-containing protein [Nonomuraea sp. ATCC 55076]AQZ62450.1 hypothetical protein BKM31_14155 [Nonomuraea sp. ATCC 55076]SPL88685.1 putative ATP/GTP-binding protein [Actinomadura parvosata subsp. kistnae]